MLTSHLVRFMRVLAICLIPYLYNYIISLSGKTVRWKTQAICGMVIEALTGKRFICVHPPWLKNPLTGRVMEIDHYNDELRIGLEYNGVQHYRYTPHFQKEKYSEYDGKIVSGQRHFELQVFRDEVKKSLCDEHGITLIIVPYTVKPTELVSYIYDKLSLIQRHRKRHNVK